MSMQLALWDETPAQQEDGIIEKTFSWADGDTTLSALDKLAVVVLGDLEQHIYNGAICFYRVVSTAVVDGKVIGACEYVSTVREFFGGSGRQQPYDGEVD